MTDRCGTKILVAEDDPALGLVLQFNLKQAGFDVTLASNGQIAWEHAASNTVHFVLTDQQMPLMSGIELCQHLRGDIRYEQIPIIMLTAQGMELELPKLARELNLSATFSKPFSPVQVVEKVEEIIGVSAC